MKADGDLFWDVLERVYSDGPRGDLYHKLTRELEGLDLEGLLRFRKLWDEYFTDVLGPAHLCAAHLVYEGMLSVDNLLMYMDAVVFVPRAVYLSIYRTPDEMLDLPDYFLPLFSYEGYPFSSAVENVGERLFGNEWQVLSRDPKWAPAVLDVRQVKFENYEGWDVVRKSLCQRLVPRLFYKYAGKIDWEETEK